MGDKCSPGESVAEIETDKASMAYEAQDEFYIAKLLIDAGVEVPVGSPMMVTVEEESFIAAFADYVPPAMEATAAAVITSTTIAAPIIEKVLAPPVLAVAPVVATPVIVAPPKAVPTQAPKVDVLIPVIQSSIPAAAQILSGSYSVNWSKGAVARSAIANKLSKDQQAYILRYGRSGQKPLSA